MINKEGYALRAVTDDNRVAGPQTINTANQDPSQRLPDLHLREEKNIAREGTVVPTNPIYGNMGQVDIAPNKIEYPDDRMDPALIQAQMAQNPLRLEGKDAIVDNELDRVKQSEPISNVQVY